MKEQVGKSWQRARPWPVDDETLCTTTFRSRCVHYTAECPLLVHGREAADLAGRVVHELYVLSTGEARAKQKGICSYCFNGAGLPMQ